MTQRFAPFPRGAWLLALPIALSVLACSSPGESTVPEPYGRVYLQDFSGRRSLEGFAFTDSRVWGWSNEGNQPSMELLAESDYQPPFPSPTSIALLPGLLFGDFDLEVDLLLTGPDDDDRDLCLLLGFQSPKRFYYVHLTGEPGESASDVLLVHDAEPVSLLGAPGPKLDWGRGEWHRIRIERRLTAGTIHVFLDGGEAPVLAAADGTLGWGQIGFGSFGATARIANVQVFAPGVRVYSGPDRIFR
jgi:hypothetical protein